MTDAASNASSPCWYELGTTDLDAAAAFYSDVLGWTVVDSGMEGMEYRLANDPEGHGVAGIMRTAHMQDAPPPNWLFYAAVASCDDTAAAAKAAGGSVVVEPTDIPNTGRFAILTDPQGAFFGVLQPEPMDGVAPTVGAFDQQRTGHGNWHQLSTSDPEAALQFYGQLLGWTKGEAMDMGEMGTYQMIQAGGTDIGGVMGLLGAPMPAWLSYFGVDKADATVDAVKAAGGQIIAGPDEVPGGAWAVTAADAQGAVFGFVGPER